MFGQLPSHVLENGTMFDILVANTLAEYENSLLNPSKPGHDLSQEQMLEMLRAARSE